MAKLSDDPIRAALTALVVLARAELDADRIPGQPAWERALADALYALAAAPEVEPPSWCETDPEQRAWQASWEARDDVMLRRAALPPSYIDPELQGEDLELLQTFYAACRAEGGTADEIHLRGLRAVLAARPAPPAEGEVAQLLTALRGIEDCFDIASGMEGFGPVLSRALDLLEQRHAAPVSVSERLPGPGDCAPWPDDPDTQPWCWLGNVIDGGWEWHQQSPGILTFIRDSYTHWLPATDLPLPAGEVQP